MEYTKRYSYHIQKCFRNYPHLKKRFQDKVNYILKNPYELGEQLQDNLIGLRSFPFVENFIIIFIICSECRRLKLEDLNNCIGCKEVPENTVIFLTFGPHDFIYYKEAEKIRRRLGNKGIHTE